MRRAGDRAAGRAAETTQRRVREGIVATDRIGSGKMLDGVAVTRQGPGLYRVSSSESYARFQEFGRGPVRPIRAKALRFKPKGSSSYVFATYVRPDPGGHFYERALAALSVRDFTR